MKILKYFIQAFFLYIFFIIIFLFRIKISRLIFSNFFRIFGPLFRSDNIIKKNLLFIDSSIKKEEFSSIKKKMWSNYGKNFVEYLFLKKFRSSNNYVNIKNENYLTDVINKKKQVIFVSGHFANFELMSMELTKKNIDLVTIYRPLNNLFINPLMEKLRKKYICQNQIKKGYSGIRESYTFLKNNFNLALMIDQRVSEGENIKLFNRNALTTTLPAQLALRFSCDIIPIYIKRKENDRFEMEIYKPILISDFKEKEISKIALSQRLNDILETMIKKDPSQWILTHNRWK